MESLADFLAVPDDKTREPRNNADEKHRAIRKLSIKALAREILTSPEYLESVYQRIKLGTLPAQIEAQLYHYGYGKPVDRQEVKDTTNRLEGTPLEVLEARSHLLQARIRELRAQKKEQVAEGSVH